MDWSLRKFRKKFKEIRHDKLSRGRDARAPQEITGSGWKDILFRVKDEIKDDRLSMVAAAMSYYALFAFIPALSAVVLIYAWISDPSEIAQHISTLKEFLPTEAMQILNEQLSTLAGAASSKIGFGAIGALLIALWSASKGSKSVMEAMNIIYDEDDDRGFIKQNIVAIGFTLSAAVMAIAAIGVIVVVPVLFSYVDFLPYTRTLITFASWGSLFFLFTFYLSFIYRYAPNRRKAKWKWVSVGSLSAAILWAIVSAGFSWYAKEFGNFNKTYGSFGAIIVLMTWFYLSSFVVLLGGEINSEVEHQTKKDTTKDPERPMGWRRARMADTVGETHHYHH